jgi:queuine/archaeosine tRNA-ribosyltransferase
MITTEVLSESGTARVLKINKGNKQLTTPAYFPAVSGARGNFPVEELIALLLSSRFPRILFSAHDFHNMKGTKRRSIAAEISEYFRNGSFVMVDSGIFECFWKRDAEWTFQRYSRSVRQIDSDFYCSFDQLPPKDASADRFIRLSIARIKSSALISESSQSVPVVHGLSPEHLVHVFARVISSLKSVPIIAVSERDCGRTLSERAITVKMLRQILIKRRQNSILHLLGCGNPISLAVYSYCGADSFDSLDWSELAIDRHTLELAHLSQLELMKCDCPACSRKIKDPIKKALLHNLRFYQDYGSLLRTNIQHGTLRDFLINHVGPDFLNRIGQ